MPPSDPDDELLDEIGDDAIVAQQAAAHAPAARSQVAQDARTIVVDEGAPNAGDTTRLRAVPRRPMDPTLVVRAVRPPVPLPVAPPAPAPVAPPAPAPVAPLPVAQMSRPLPSWLWWLVWGLAGLAALVLGGVLAVIANRREAPPAPPPASVSSVERPAVTK